MATLGLIEYKDASPEVRAVYDDIMATRKVDWINNFWKSLAHDPATLRRTWESVKQIMSPVALGAATAGGKRGREKNDSAPGGAGGGEKREIISLPVSATNQCGYCIAS